MLRDGQASELRAYDLDDRMRDATRRDRDDTGGLEDRRQARRGRHGLRTRFARRQAHRRRVRIE